MSRTVDADHIAGSPGALPRADAGTMEHTDVLVIGGGQAGLAAGYFLRRTPLRFLILDDGEAPGGAWRYTWDSLTLFSPAQWSSLPGWLMLVPPAA